VTRPVALITGAGSGIGLAVAEEFGATGVRLALSHFGETDALASLRLALSCEPEDIFDRRVDVQDRDACAAFVGDALDHFDGVDVLVTCAGVHRWGASDALDWAAWDETIAVNLTGTFTFIRAVLPSMLKRGGGRIITFASELALTGREEDAAYCASKGAVVSMTKALAREYASRGILVNCVAPGPVDTPMMRASPEHDDPSLLAQMPIGRYGEPNEIAKVVASLAGDGGTFFVGQVLSPNGGAVI
jgi:3-oxoacyl-[acyl-carrier protein] reductase